MGKRRDNYVKTHDLYKLIFLFVVFLGIGYAFLEANLNINGDVTVAAPQLNVYVQSTSVTTGSTSGTPSIIGNDKKEVDFSTALTNDGSSFFEETSTLINKGTEDARFLGIDINVYDLNDELVTLSSPYEYTITNGDGTAVEVGHKLTSGSTETYKIRFNYEAGTDMSTVLDYPTYTFKIVYNYAIYVPFLDLPEGRSATTLQVGDEICIDEALGVSDQCFYFIRYDENDDIVMLSKYNLKVGDIYDTSFNKIGQYTSADSGYGLQSSETVGFKSGNSTYNGAVPFSATNYWANGSSLKAKYGSSYNTSNIYDPDYATEPDFSTACNSTNCWKTPGYSVAYYVERYRNILEEYGVTLEDARLLTYSEGEATAKIISFTGTFLMKTSFWLGSAYSSEYVYMVLVPPTNNYFDKTNYDNIYGYGVRPVIVISPSMA